MNYKNHHEIAIIGGGASGLAVAALLSRSGRKSLIIERNSKPGKKLLATGNGRCNLGHFPLEMSHYHGDIGFAEHIFADWKGAQAFFRDFGLICRRDTEGRLYPYSNTANSVLEVLRSACTKTEFLLETDCTTLESVKNGFLINKNIFARKVVWACGGFNSPLEILKGLGHTLIPPFPALCPIITDKSLTNPLKGIRVRALCKAVANNKVIKSEYGEVQFNRDSLSGICIMNLSRLVRDHSCSLTLSLDLAPEFTQEQLNDIPLKGLLHSKIAAVLEKEKNPRKTLKDLRFPVKSAATIEQAQIMSGGIPADELNHDLSSKIHPNLYIIGESVNVDGDCGGYNLEWAWASADVCYKSLLNL
ncbi:MAG: NAD(P)/FAD-dependent oxidoreductase [Oscillospiraceae bacterium]|nr:NAD(P)/FAD-dependent oxidoreductase [Oscillospiraceae bacterium]